MTKLPDGWEIKRLDEIADVVMGQSPPGSSYNVHGEGQPFFQGKTEFGEVHPTVRKYTTAGTKFAKAGDILMSVRAPVGPTNIADIDCVIGRGLAAIRAKSVVSQSYLRWTLKHLEIDIQSKGTGTTFDAITGETLRGTLIALPPLAEQHKIVERLEDHLSRLDAALNDLLKAHKMCSSLLAASFKSIVESVPHSYRPLSEVVQKIEAGKSFTCLGRPAEKEEWGVIKVSAMTWGEFLPSENKAAPLEYNPPPHHKINVGDILFSRANTQKYVGAAVRVKKEPGKLLLSDKSLRIIPKSDYDASWLLAALSSPVTREEISKRATGNEDSMRNISQKNLLGVLIPVPVHQDGQSEIVESLSLVETGVASNLQIIEQNLLRMNWFRRSLLNKAFTGQLTNEVVSV